MADTEVTADGAFATGISPVVDRNGNELFVTRITRAVGSFDYTQGGVGRDVVWAELSDANWYAYGRNAEVAESATFNAGVTYHF